MGKAYALMLIGLIGLMMSCGAVEQLDHSAPVKPMARVIDQDMVDRIRRANSGHWNHGARKIKQIANN